MCLKFLYNFIGVDDSCHFLQLSKGLLIVIQLLPLIIFIVLVACPKDGVWLCGVGAPLSLGHTFSDWCFLIDLFLFL